MKIVKAWLCGVALASATSLSIPVWAADAVNTRVQEVAVKHIVVETRKPYNEVCAFIESKIGRFDEPMHEMLKNGQVDQLRTAAIHAVDNPYGLSIHYINHHGLVLALNGKTENLKAYYIGDLLSASKMTRVVRAAGLYAPLRIVVYQNETGGTTIEYDQPSSLFGQFGNSVVDDVGHNLDVELGKLVHDAAS